MLIRVKPYYCPHCNKFKNRSEIYHSFGQKPMRGTTCLCVEGWLPFCSGCDSPVEEVKPIIDNAIFNYVKSQVKEKV